MEEKEKVGVEEKKVKKFEEKECRRSRKRRSMEGKEVGKISECAFAGRAGL